jgi:hypothetical protein
MYIPLTSARRCSPVRRQLKGLAPHPWAAAASARTARLAIRGRSLNITCMICTSNNTQQQRRQQRGAPGRHGFESTRRQLGGFLIQQDAQSKHAALIQQYLSSIGMDIWSQLRRVLAWLKHDASRPFLSACDPFRPGRSVPDCNGHCKK